MFSALRMAVLAGAVAMMGMGCSKEEPAGDSDYKPRPEPTFNNSASTQPAGSGAMTGNQLPAGHPPIGGATSSMPAGHPAIGEMMAASRPGAGLDDLGIELSAPADWQPKQARMMTLKVFAAPKVEGDPEDADVAISNLGSKVPLKMNTDRWCGQFGYEGTACEGALQKKTLDGTAYPTTIVELSGTYTGGGMMGQPSAPKKDFKMLAAEIVTPDKPYYVKMIGPAKTVEHWRAAFMEMVQKAK